jgi:hypothetical protein
MQDIPEQIFDINTLSCYVCKYTATTKSNFKNHLFSMKHNKNVRKMHEKVDEVIDNATLNKIEDMYSTYKPTFSEVPEVPEVSEVPDLPDIEYTPPPLHITSTLTEPPKQIPRRRKPEPKKIQENTELYDEDTSYSQLFDDCYDDTMGGMQNAISVSAVFTSFVAVAGYFIYVYSN